MSEISAARKDFAAEQWDAAALQASDEWIVYLDESDFAEFELALSLNHNKEILSITGSDFPLPRFSERVREFVDLLDHGLGFLLLRSLPVPDRFSEAEAVKIFWGIGLHMGELVTQNRQGDVLGQLRDLGAPGPFQRVYATNEAQGFHTDSTDFVGLLCLHQGIHGGDSLVASTSSLYNIIVEEHPEYIPILFKNFPTDWKNEEPAGWPGWYLEPLFSEYGGVLSGTVRTGRVVTAQRFGDVTRLTGEEMSCLLYIESVLKRPELALSMRLEPGDIQFVNNFVTLHARTSFVDDASDTTRQRHLVRLWISRTVGGRPLCPEYAVWRRGYAR